MKRFEEFLREERGEGLIEYGLLAAFVAAVGTACLVKDPVGFVKALSHVYKSTVKLLNKV